ncbi:S8 family serine peptidase, partial [bacterium]|nr:S8 family serine peptidase [bacterium]
MRKDRWGSILTAVLIMAMVVLVCSAKFAAAEKIKIEKADDLPKHSYKIEMKVVDLLADEAAFKQFMNEVKADIEADLKKYEIEDKTTLKGFYANLGTIAFIEGRYQDYLKFLDMRLELEDKESAKLTKGLFTRAYINVLKSGAEDTHRAFQKEYKAMVEKLPFETVQSDLESSKGSAEIVSENLILGMVNDVVQPSLDKNNGEMDKDLANSIIGRYFTLNYYIPYKDDVLAVLTAHLDANKVVKPDIWDAREVTLTKKDKGNDVIVGIWDAGVDAEVYKDNRFVNKKEKLNQKDDDGNGFVDDLYGIAYDKHADKTPELLYPIGNVDDRPRMQSYMKGITDLQSNIDSKEASELKKLLSQMKPEEVKPFLEDLGAYGNHCHGTHVAGIAVRGNPYAKVLAARLTFDHHYVPVEPTIEWGKKTGKLMEETCQYFRDHGVRVVNMSWIYTRDEINAALEANGAGGSIEERKELTNQIFDLIDAGLRKGISEASDILFIGGAGNADNDIAFEGFIPCSYDLPNLMSIGAVDQAGDETNFSSFGKVDAYANGFEVMSYVPGGDRMALSGTSMASPNVTNLAAKLF